MNKNLKTHKIFFFVILIFFFPVFCLSANEDFPEPDFFDTGFPEDVIYADDFLDSGFTETSAYDPGFSGLFTAEPDLPEPDFFEPNLSLFDTVKEEIVLEEPVEKTEQDEKPARFRNGRIKNRGFELSFFNFNNFGFSNNLLSTGDYIKNPFAILFSLKSVIADWTNVFKNNDQFKVFFDDEQKLNIETEINLDTLFNEGFKLDFGAFIQPFSVNFNHRDKWGFGFDIAHLDIEGNISLSGKPLTLIQAEEEKFGVGAAVFVDFAIPMFFHVNEFKVKLRPAAFLPVVYARPGITYVHKEINNGVYIALEYDMRFYTPVNLSINESGQPENVMDNFTMNDIWPILRNNLGYDLGFSLEYPLFPWLDLGTDIYNLPLPFLGARLNHYISMKDSIYIDTSHIDLADLINGGELPEDAYYIPDGPGLSSGYNPNGDILRRPFKMLFYANYRPFDSTIIQLIPVMGFSVSKLYPRPGAFEGGANVCFDFKNFLILSLGSNYMDRKWMNSIDTVFNVRLFQLSSGIIFQSPNFVKSWKGAGFAFNFGFKIGW